MSMGWGHADDAAMSTQAVHRPADTVRKRVLRGGLLAALAASLLLAVPSLRTLIAPIRDMSPGWLLIAVALEVLSCVSFVVVFRLFFDRLGASDARGLAWTSMASGALLPGGGVGGLAVGGWLISLTGAPIRWIVRRSSALFFITSATSVAAVVAAGIVLLPSAGDAAAFARAGLPVLVGLALAALVLSLPARARRRPPRRSSLGDLAQGIRDARDVIARPSWRVTGAVGYLAFDIGVLWACLAALGSPPPMASLVLGYSIGYLANTLPVPGGAGVLDGGLAGALALYHVPGPHIAAAILVYHAIALWVPGLGGVVAYARLRTRLTQARDQGARSGCSPEVTDVVPGDDRSTPGQPAGSIARGGVPCHQF
jgi:uncharacterized membrane protein YbhN (UPF0104 family)